MSIKTAVITGATSGLGAAYARHFAKEGYSLIITGRRKEKIEAVAQEIRERYGVTVEIVLAELSQDQGLQSVVDTLAGRPVDILVNNAGFGVVSYYQQTERGPLLQMAKVNVLAPIILIHAVLPGMIERKSGTVINIASEGAFIVIPKNAVYAGAKAFLKTFTEGLSLDLYGTGVRVMAVCPGLIHTDFHEKLGMPKSRQKNHGIIHWMEPEEVVALSIKDLYKGKTVSIPGFHTKLLIAVSSILPKKLYYKVMRSFGDKKKGRSRN